MNSRFFSVKAISACLLGCAVLVVPSVSQASPRDAGCYDTGENAHLYPNETVVVNAGYNDVGCYNSAVVDVYGLYEPYTVDEIGVSWHGITVSGQQACNETFLSTQLYVWQNGGWVMAYGTGVTTNGSWTGTSCVYPSVNYFTSMVPATENGNYRVAFQAELSQGAPAGQTQAVLVDAIMSAPLD
jgi:hypothetical protein